MQLFAVLALTCGVTLIGVAFIGETTRADHRRVVEQQKPKPAPQMTAPAPSHGDRVQFGLIESHHTGRGW
jgi:hypothetical protein